jgi:hypothetical protein
MINASIETRKLKAELAEHHNLNMGPEFAKVLDKCLNISSKTYQLVI